MSPEALEAEFHKDTKQIEERRMPPGMKLEEFESFARLMRDKWKSKERRYYLPIMRELVRTFGGYGFVDYAKEVIPAQRLAYQWAMEVLQEKGEIPLEIQAGMIMSTWNQTRRDLEEANDEERTELRRERAELCLKAARLIEQQVDRNFDPRKDLPSASVAPPPSAGFPSGIAPGAIKDPKLRAEYEAAIRDNAHKAEKHRRQHQARDLDGMYSRQVEKFLAEVYSKPPYDLLELRRLLDAYIPDKERKERIVSAAAANIRQAEQQGAQ